MLTVSESAVAVQMYSVSKRVGMASIFGLVKGVNFLSWISQCKRDNSHKANCCGSKQICQGTNFFTANGDGRMPALPEDLCDNGT